MAQKNDHSNDYTYMNSADSQFPIDLLDESNSIDGRISSRHNFYPLKEALQSEEYNKATGSLLIPVGKNERDNLVVADLHKLGHIIAGGQTGSGKSSFTEGAITLSLLYQHSADELKLILIDPKMVQFRKFNGIPHLLWPVITTLETSEEAIGWLLAEMEERLKKIAASGVETINEYNAKEEERLPFIVLIIDEVSDLMMMDARYYEDTFVSLFEKSASVGIHIYIGTSRPSVNVITDRMKASNDTRAAFKTSSSVDSHRLIDGAGAEQLNGAGDMLFQLGEYTEPIRLQAPYVSMHEQKRAIEYIKSHDKSEERRQ